VWTEDISDTRAVVCGRRKGSDYVERVTVTMEQARKAGWTSNQAYAKTPQDMLYARAAGRVCDRVAPDVLMGIASVEEIRDEIQATAEVGNGQRVVAPRKRAAPAAIEASVEEPPLDDLAEEAREHERIEEAEAPPERPIGTITGPQQKMLHTLLGQTGRGDRDIALVYISGVLDREVLTTKELSKADAGKVIDALTVESAELEPALDEDGA
jgi:hypothetical protein